MAERTLAGFVEESGQRLRCVALWFVWALTWILIASSAALAAPSGAHDDATARHPFDDVERWRKVFDDPRRDEWQKPDELIRALRLKPGACVADLGAGTGYFLHRLSDAVGELGAVFAVEVEPNLVRHLRQRAEQERLANVVPVLASADNPRLPAGALDLILIVDTYHHIDDRLSYMRQLRTRLAPGGRVAIIDWYKRPLPEGPQPPHKLTRRKVTEEMEAAGYHLLERPRMLPFQYFLIFAPKGT